MVAMLLIKKLLRLFKKPVVIIQKTPEWMIADAQELVCLAEHQLTQAAWSFELWSHCLRKQYGRVVGQKMIDQQIEPGMNVIHLFESFGKPDSITSHGGIITIQYGDTTGCLFQVVGDTVTRAVIGRRPHPPIPSLAFTEVP